MQRELLVVAVALIALGTAAATGAAPFDGSGPTDELAPATDAGLYIGPADTPNGDRYAAINADGNLTVSVDVIAGTETRFDDVFEVHFAGVAGTSEAATVWLGHENDDRVSFYRMDSGAPVNSESNAIELAPGETVRIGFVVGDDADVQSSFTETVVYHASIPQADDDTTLPPPTGQGTDTPADDTPTASPDTPVDTPADDTPTDTSTSTTTTSDPDTPTDDTPTDTPTQITTESGPDTGTDDATTDTATASGPDTPTETDTEAGSGTETDTTTEQSGETDAMATTETERAAGGGANPTETPPAAIEIVDLTVDPPEPDVGETVTVTGTFENVGTTERTVTLQLQADGEVIASETVTLAPGERRTISGTTTFDDSGSYEVALGDRSITVTVGEESQSPLEIGAFAPVILAVLALLAGGLGLLAYWRRGPTLVVRANDASWSRVELVPDADAGATETDEDGRTQLRFDLSGSGLTTFDPAFSVRNTVAATVGLRLVAVDDEGESITSGVTIQSADGTDLTAFPADEAAENVLDGGESLSVRVTIDRDDEGATRIASLQVETTTDQP